MVDALAVAEKLRLTHPNHFATLVRVPVTFQRVHYDRCFTFHISIQWNLRTMNTMGPTVLSLVERPALSQRSHEVLAWD